MFRISQLTFLASLFVFATIVSEPVKADVLSLIESNCRTLGATQYQIAFLTSGGTTATSTNIQTYNSFVTAEASQGASYLGDFVPTGTRWNAIGSTASVDAKNNSPAYAGVPIFNTIGELVATGSTQLWGTTGSSGLANPVEYDEYGSLENPIGVFTGSASSGIGNSIFVLGGTIAGVECGYANTTTFPWLESFNTRPTYDYPLYALSTPIAVPVVPEPSTLTLLGVGGIGLLAYARRRRRTAWRPNPSTTTDKPFAATLGP